MPSIHASQKVANSAMTAAVRNTVKNVNLTRDAAARLFMPAFTRATTYVAIPPVTSVQKETKRSFSSAMTHEHDKIREQWKHTDDELIDYGKARQNEHLHLEKIDLIDYWNDNRSKFSETPLKKFAVPRRFTSESYATPPSSKNVNEIDYWTEHNDTHFTD